MSAVMTQPDATRIQAALAACGVEARVVCDEGCVRLPDGTYGPIVTTWRVQARLQDVATGNGVSRDVRDTGEGLTALVAEMRAELAAAARATRGAIRRERRPT